MQFVMSWLVFHTLQINFLLFLLVCHVWNIFSDFIIQYRTFNCIQNAIQNSKHYTLRDLNVSLEAFSLEKFFLSKCKKLEIKIISDYLSISIRTNPGFRDRLTNFTSIYIFVEWMCVCVAKTLGFVIENRAREEQREKKIITKQTWI